MDVGSFGVTSIAIGQPTNRASAGIYIGLRGTNGNGQLMEFTKNGGIWQSNVVAVSTNAISYILGVRAGADILASFSTNGIDAGLFSLSLSNGTWIQTILSTNRGDQTLGAHGTVWSRMLRDASIRLVNTNQIEIIAADREAVKNGLLLPTNWAFNPVTGKYYFQSTNTMSWYDGESFAQQYGAHLVTIADTTENFWIASQFSRPYWIGLYFTVFNGSAGSIFGGWISLAQPPSFNCGAYYFNLLWDGNPCGNFESAPPYVFPRDNGIAVGLNGNERWNSKLPSNQYRAVADATGVQTYSNRWLLPASLYPNRVIWKENQIALAKPRAQDTNSTALLTCFVSDTDLSGTVSAPDVFTFAEYRISGDAVTLVTLTNIPVGSGSFAQSFGLAAVDFLNSGSDYIFTAEPNGAIYFWLPNAASSPLQRQLFTADYTGKAWQALAGVRTTGGGQALIGLMVNPTNQNTCNVIFWPSLAALSSPQSGIIETAPAAVVVPSANPLGNTAVVTVRLWDNEGNASTPFLQYQILGATNWQNATLTTLDGVAYNPATRVTALPTGYSHVLAWNAQADLGGGVNTNILLRARAQDFSLVGDWSSPTPFAVNMNLDSNTNGIPDWWEYQYFGQLVSASADPDHDGFSNYAEYIADTNPNDANSNLRFTKIQKLPGNNLAVLWQSGINSTQFLQWKQQLGSTSIWVNRFTNLPPTPNPSGFTNPMGTNGSGFYRLNVTR